MAKKVIDLQKEVQSASFNQNTALQFTANAITYKVVDFAKEVTAKQTEDILSVIGEILPALRAVDSEDNISALQMLVSAITSEKALLRRLLAMLFLPEDKRVYTKADVDERVEIIGDLPLMQYIEIAQAVKDVFAFVAAYMPNASTILSSTFSK